MVEVLNQYSPKKKKNTHNKLSSELKYPLIKVRKNKRERNDQEQIPGNIYCINIMRMNDIKMYEIEEVVWYVCVEVIVKEMKKWEESESGKQTA